MIATMKRRKFISLLGGAAAWPVTARAQQHKMLRVGFVGMQPREAPHYKNFLRRMAELGYQEGRNFKSKPRMSMAMTKAIKNSRHAMLTCSWRSGTSVLYVRRYWLPRGSQSHFWPS